MIDRVVDQYLSRYEIHLENALSELKTVRDFVPLRKQILTGQSTNRRLNWFLHFWQIFLPIPLRIWMQNRLLLSFGNWFNWKTESNTKKKPSWQSGKPWRNPCNKVLPFVGLDYDINQILQFKYVKFRFGQFPVNTMRSSLLSYMTPLILFYSHAMRMRTMSGLSTSFRIDWLIK